MPVKSYITFPQPGKKELLIKILQENKYCEVLPSVNKDIIVLITDTINDEQEEALQRTIETIKEIEHLTLVSGFNDNNPQEHDSINYDNE